MSSRSPRHQGLLDLWAAHRELSTLEWLEFRGTMVRAAVWLLCATLGALSGWLALNATVILALRDDPMRAALAVTGVNVVIATLAAWRVRRLLGRPFFEHTRREATRDASTLLKVIT